MKQTKQTIYLCDVCGKRVEPSDAENAAATTSLGKTAVVVCAVCAVKPAGEIVDGVCKSVQSQNQSANMENVTLTFAKIIKDPATSVYSLKASALAVEEAKP